jgi:mannose-6-phosphate isomerase-like protein (cupin superfamily)
LDRRRSVVRLTTVIQSTNLDAVLATFDQLWSPRIVGQVNNYDVRVAKVQGEYVWHSHADTDEFFLVLHGHLNIAVRTGATEELVSLAPGEMYVVPKGVVHKPMTEAGASILMFELTGTLTTGNYNGEVPDHIDSTVGHSLA